MASHNCDLCGASARTEIEPGISVCMGCGFVYVPERRNSMEIAKAWSEVYASGAYDPEWPGVKARLYYVAEWIEQNLGLAGKSILDIGAGLGVFLEQVRARGGHPVGLEPDLANVAYIKSQDIACFHGAIEDHSNLGQYDIVSLLWTLENCGDCLRMLRWARRHLAPGGRVVVATGSRVLVPYKKPYGAYFGTLSPDLHCFRWSCNAIRGAFGCAGLLGGAQNDYLQNDVMLAVAEAGHASGHSMAYTDVPEAVIDFFREWKRQWP